MLLKELVAVAEATDEAVKTVDDPVDVLDMLEVMVPVPVAEVVDSNVVVEEPSPFALEEAKAESVVAEDCVVVSSCRGIGRTTPAKTTFRDKKKAKRARILWDAVTTLMLRR